MHTNITKVFQIIFPAESLHIHTHAHTHAQDANYTSLIELKYQV